MGKGDAEKGRFESAGESRSISVYIQCNGFDYLVAGDLMGNDSSYLEQVLRDLLVSTSDSPSDDPIYVLRVNHHGSNTSSEQSYLNALKPEVTIISVGNGNSYGHPSQEVIDRLHNIQTKPLMHVYLMEKGETGRDYHGMLHYFICDRTYPWFL